MTGKPRISALFALAALVLATVAGTANAQTASELALIQRLGKQADSAKSNAKTLEETLAAARTIDEYMTSIWKEQKVTPQKVVNDQVFLRRAYLDIAGRIPSLEETLAFYRDRSPNKRSKLIDKLLNSEAFTSHMFNYWADLLRVRSDMDGGGDEYGRFVKNAIRANLPYDKFVYELLTAEGYTWENGAAGYYLRDSGMPLDNMSNTLQIFLGTSMVCAQCHDHPFDNWSQYEFYEMAAYTIGQNTRIRAKNVEAAKKMLSNEMERDALDDVTRILGYGVSWDENRNITLPYNYKYDDAKPGQMVKPYTIFGEEPKFGDGVSRREAYAKWLTSPSNPRFTMVIANRMWDKVFNRGLFEPIDEVMDDTEPLDQGLMDYLSHKMVQYDYDLKQFLRVLYNTTTYQRQLTVEELDPDAPYLFTGSMLRRMTAEQVWDTMVTLAIPDPDHRYRTGRPGGMGGGRYATSNAEILQYMSPENLVKLAKEQAKYNDARNTLREMIVEARTAKNMKKVQALNKEMRALKAPNVRDYADYEDSAENDRGPTKNMELMSGMDKGMKDDMKMDPGQYKGYDGSMYRASELRSPGGGFLAMFGQSDRDVINNSNREPNLPQVLATFNSNMVDKIGGKNSLMMKTLNKVSDPAEKVQVIFLSMLNRKPTSREMKLVEPFARKNDYMSIVWAVMNMREFTFVQ